MSKAVRKVERTNAPPGFIRFERHKPIDAAAAKLRKRAMAERLKGSGRKLADANSKTPTPANGETE